jgi:hypothetical protein
VEDLHDVSGNGAIDLETRREKNRLGAQPEGRPGGHSGVNPELSGLVGTVRNDASPIRRPTDDHCSAAQFRLIALFDRRIKGIHIDMYNGAVLWHFLSFQRYACSHTSAYSVVAMMHPDYCYILSKDEKTQKPVLAIYSFLHVFMIDGLNEQYTLSTLSIAPLGFKKC